MAKTIANPVAEPAAPAGAQAPARAASGVAAVRAWPLLVLVFVAGAGGMAVEMVASRLLAPHFGNSLYSWAILIGLILFFLTTGYTVGGRLADRRPRPGVLYGLVAAVGVWILAVPLVAGPVLHWAERFPTADASVEFGTALSILILFAVPVTLLGCVSPFAVRLRIHGVGEAGHTAGRLYALATLGSIAGTFAPVFLLMPYLGVSATLDVTGLALLAVAGLGGLAGRAAGVTIAPRPSTAPAAAAPAVPAVPDAAGPRPGPGLLLASVAAGGVASLALELTASQLMRPYFGASLFIWANLIGLVLIYLTVGYDLGGRLADRRPTPGRLFTLIAVAGLAAAIIPALAQPLLSWSLAGFAEVSVGIFYGSLAGVIGLFAVPMILVGTVSPFAIRLHMRQVDAAGQTAGAIYAVSTLGSMIGTFVPVFILLPTLGSGRTLYLVALLLLGMAALGLFVLRRRAAWLVSAAFAGVVVLTLLPPPALIKPPPYGHLLAERESVYNYIQVVGQDNGDVNLVLNEGHAVHSIYRADQTHPLTGGPWDYWLVAPYVNANMRPAGVQNMLMLGSAAGTAAQLFTRVYGPKPVDDVELDPAIVDLAHQYFHLDQPNIHNIINDARVYLRTTDRQYSIIGIDAYRQPYIPFQLTTREFFTEVQQHLTPDGVAMINAGRAGDDYRLVNAIAATMRAVFPHVYIIDVAGMGNSMIVGAAAGNGVANFRANAQANQDPLLAQVFAAAIDQGNMREVAPASVTGQLVFTDDRAPVEEVIDQVILSYVIGQ